MHDALLRTPIYSSHLSMFHFMGRFGYWPRMGLIACTRALHPEFAQIAQNAGSQP